MKPGTPPYILAHEGEITLFGSLDALARYVEAPSLDGARAFDSEGRVIALSSPPVHRRFGFVSVPPVTATLTEHRQPDELRDALRSYVVDRAALPENDLEGEVLTKLLERASSFASYTP
jgi:hypothetical protein